MPTYCCTVVCYCMAYYLINYVVKHMISNLVPYYSSDSEVVQVTTVYNSSLWGRIKESDR